MPVGGLDSTCGMKADPACQWLPTVIDHFPPVDGILKGIGLGLQRWEEDDERNTGHIGKKKKKKLYKFSWQERAAGTFPNRVPSSIFLSRCYSGKGVMNGLLWGRERRPLSLPGHAQNNISAALHQIDPPGSISVVRTQLADLQLQDVFG